jgi:hypothetical protein
MILSTHITGERTDRSRDLPVVCELPPRRPHGDSPPPGAMRWGLDQVLLERFANAAPSPAVHMLESLALAGYRSREVQMLSVEIAPPRGGGATLEQMLRERFAEAGPSLAIHMLELLAPD